ncbi:hypothetical protein OSB04_un001783 [Centaurea solstitialis]|uniref:Ribosomal protein L7/L12 C-terminal domain-containing protein n=1 Tax=Centaurea solstitialis TaxID=347529 RepID=A0AA38S1I8_9ASTR|nr:hypothetical protein OSB04_un001783 [Centaurea solstitialis]
MEASRRMSSLTLSEVAELSSIMMKKMGMKEPPVVAVMKPGPAGVAATAGQTAAKRRGEAGKDHFRAETGIAPIVFKKGVTKEEGEQIIEKLKAVGAKVVME